jgi:AcrR family transcriptional regulator
MSFDPSAVEEPTKEEMSVPTGVAIHDPRDRLFEAAERVLLRDGPSALTSRAITCEAGFAKGVLHRHFSDTDSFLAELVADRIARIERQAAALLECAGTGTVVDNVSNALTEVFGSVAVVILGLVISRDDLRSKLRLATPTGIPVLSEATAMVASYLTAEQEIGRISADAEIATLAPTLVGAAHLLFADRESSAPGPRAVRHVVTAVIGSALQS